MRLACPPLPPVARTGAKHRRAAVPPRLQALSQWCLSISCPFPPTSAGGFGPRQRGAAPRSTQGAAHPSCSPGAQLIRAASPGLNTALPHIQFGENPHCTPAALHPLHQRMPPV